jgi:hypothetical protein
MKQQQQHAAHHVEHTDQQLRVVQERRDRPPARASPCTWVGRWLEGLQDELTHPQEQVPGGS